jgi:hypothetical protein
VGDDTSNVAAVVSAGVAIASAVSGIPQDVRRIVAARVIINFFI